MRILFALFSILLCSCNQAFYQPTHEEYFRVDPKQIPYQDFMVRNDKGNLLHARLFKSRTDSTKGLIVHFHGNAENLTSHFLNFFWTGAEGFDYLIFDYSGYGNSEGEPSREQVSSDGTTILQFALDSIPSAHKKLLVIGQSLGGAIAPVSVARWPRKDAVSLLVLDATFDRYPTAARRAMSMHWLTWIFQPLGWLLVDGSENPRDYYADLKGVPTLVTHCLDDNIVAGAFSAEIYSQLLGPKELQTFPICGHTGYFYFPRTQGRRKLMNSTYLK